MFPIDFVAEASGEQEAGSPRHVCSSPRRRLARRRTDFGQCQCFLRAEGEGGEALPHYAPHPSSHTVASERPSSRLPSGPGGHSLLCKAARASPLPRAGSVSYPGSAGVNSHGAKQ